MRQTRHANFRLTIEAITLLAQLSDQMGISRTAIIELLIREKAEARKILVSQGNDEREHVHTE